MRIPPFGHTFQKEQPQLWACVIPFKALPVLEPQGKWAPPLSFVSHPPLLPPISTPPFLQSVGKLRFCSSPPPALLRHQPSLIFIESCLYPLHNPFLRISPLQVRQLSPPPLSSSHLYRVTPCCFFSARACTFRQLPPSSPSLCAPPSLDNLMTINQSVSSFSLVLFPSAPVPFSFACRGR